MISSENYLMAKRIIINRTLTRIQDRKEAGCLLCAVFFVLENHSQWIVNWFAYYIRYP